MASDNMCFGIVGSEHMVRVGPDAHSDCLALRHAREMDFTGRLMRGMVYVDDAGLAEDAELADWLGKASPTVLGRYDEAEVYFTHATAFNDRAQANCFAARLTFRERDARRARCSRRN